MSEVRYTDQHEWVRVDGDEATVGITKYAAEQLGDVVFVELPASGKKVGAGGEAAVVESVKAASEVYAPVGGEVTDANAALGDDPARSMTIPEGEGWFFKLSSPTRPSFDQADGSRRLSRRIRDDRAMMRYLPSPRRPPRDAGQDRRAGHRRAVPRRAARPRRCRAASICPTRRASWKSSARCRRWRRKNVAAGSVPFFCGAGAYKHHVPARWIT